MSMLEDYARIFIVGCGTCPTVCKTGGIEETVDMENLLKGTGKLITGKTVLSAVCDTPRSLFLEQGGRDVKDAQAIVVMSCGLGVQNVAGYGLQPVVPVLDSLFFGIESGPGEYEESCLQCGECILGYTGGVCPVTSCHKGLLNGPCGGTNDGMCEVGEGRVCAWSLIYEKLEKIGRLDLMKQYQSPRNFNSHLRPGMWKIEEEEEKKQEGGGS